MRQGTKTHVNIVTDVLGAWEDRPMGCHDYPKS